MLFDAEFYKTLHCGSLAFERGEASLIVTCTAAASCRKWGLFYAAAFFPKALAHNTSFSDFTSFRTPFHSPLNILSVRHDSRFWVWQAPLLSPRVALENAEFARVACSIAHTSPCGLAELSSPTQCGIFPRCFGYLRIVSLTSSIPRLLTIRAARNLLTCLEPVQPRIHELDFHVSFDLISLDHAATLYETLLYYHPQTLPGRVALYV